MTTTKSERFVPWRTIWAVLGSLLLLAMVGFAMDLFLLAFLSVLGALFLRSLSNALRRVVKIPDVWALTLTIFLLTAIAVGLGFAFAPAISEQFDELTESVPKAFQQLKGQVEQTQTGRRIVQQLSNAHKLVTPKDLSKASGAIGAIGATLGGVATLGVIAVMILFFAYAPGPYVNGALRLVPPKGRKRAAEVLTELGDTLAWWNVGKAFSMTVIAIMTTVGLWALGIPLALILGLLAGLLSFIPNIGPIVASAPAILLALAQDPTKAIWVAVLAVVVQLIEGNVLTPFVEKKTVYILPAMVIFTQLLFGVLFGFLGVLLATPLAAVVIVMVRMLYVEPMEEKV